MGELTMNRYLFTAVITLGLLTGCDKESGVADYTSDMTGKEVIASFSSSINDAYSVKTSISDNVNGVRKVQWTDSDMIRITSGDGSHVTTSINSDGTMNDVTLMRSNIYFASYPADIEPEIKTAESTVSFNIPSEQAGTFDSANYMIALATDEERHFVFRNMTSMLRIEIESEEYDKLVIRSNDGGPIAGDIQAILNMDGEIESVTSGSMGSPEITIPLNGKGTYYVGLLADIGIEGGLGFRFFKDGTPMAGILSVTPIDADRSSMVTISRPEVNIIASKKYHISPDGTGDGSSWERAGGVRLLSSLLSENITEGVTNEGYTNAWRIDGATIHLAKGKYTLSDFSICFKEDVEFSVVGADDGETILTTENGSILTFKAENSKATFSNLTFTGGKSVENGGAVLMSSNSILEFDRCIFSDNGAGDKSKTTATNVMLGGAVHLSNGEVHFNRCIFDGNYANLGAHISMTSAYPKVFINRSVFKNGTAYHQKGEWLGAAINSANTNATLCINNSVFYNNASPNTTTNDGLPCIRTNGVKTLVMNSSFAHKGLRTINPTNGGTGAQIINNMTKNLGSRAIDIANSGIRKYNITVTSATENDTNIDSNDNLTIVWEEETNLLTWTLANVTISKWATVDEISTIVSTNFESFGTWLKSVETDPYGIDFYGNVRNKNKMNPGAWDNGIY